MDTGGFYASLNRSAYHRDAARLFRRAQREHWFLFITNFVLAESHALILARVMFQICSFACMYAMLLPSSAGG